MVTGNGIHIGKILGIDIDVDWSWLLIFTLVTWNLANTLSHLSTAWPLSLVWGMAVLAACLFFGSVLAHELAHSLVARAQGLPVRRIVLFIFGGVSNIQREPDSPGAEFAMAIVGPITSLVIGGALLLLVSMRLLRFPLSLARPQAFFRALGPVGALALWLGTVNILLGLFNLVPAFPLDGGRVLRSVLWGLTGSLSRATHWATALAQGIAWLFIVLGISMVFGVRIPLLGSGVINGLWLAFIGWFLSNAAMRSYRQVMVEDILVGVPVTQLMRRDPPVVPPDLSVADLVHEYILGTDDYGFPVVENGALVGMVTLEDVRKLERHRWENTMVREIMTPREVLLTVTAQDDAATAFNRLMERDVRQLPVLADGEFVGLLRRNDLIRWLQLQSREPV